MFQQGDFIIAYYKADRVFRAQIPNHVEKVELQDKYIIYRHTEGRFCQISSGFKNDRGSCGYRSEKG